MRLFKRKRKKLLQITITTIGPTSITGSVQNDM